MYILFFVFCFVVLLCVLFVCKCVLYCTVLYCTVLLPPGVNPTAANKYIVSYHITSHPIPYHIIYQFLLPRTYTNCTQHGHYSEANKPSDAQQNSYMSNMNQERGRIIIHEDTEDIISGMFLNALISYICSHIIDKTTIH